MAAALMNVTPENVLKARAVILTEAEDLMRYLVDKFVRGDRLMGLCGGDPISRDAQELFNERIRAVAVTPIQQYVIRLQDVAEQLATTARSYGFTERQIAESFSPKLGQRA